MDPKEAQLERSRKYGIAPKEGGHLTIPSEHRRRWPGISEEDYLDPVNYRYPCPDAEQTAVAARYWGQADNRAQYTEEEQRIIERRLEEFKRKFKVGEYAEASKDAISLALAADGAPQWIQVLPAGLVRSQKGEFLVDQAAAQEILKWWSGRKNDLVIDYEHQTLSGQEAPAAGWIKELVWRGQEGLWARVEWTPRARQYIANREYRYLSPVVLVRRSDGRAVALHSAALTNTPAVDGMVPIVNKEEVESMGVLVEIRAALGLPEGTPDERVLAEVKALSGRAAHREVLELLDLPESAGLSEVKGKILALKNPSGYVRVEEFNALREEIARRDRDELVKRALEEGKVSPAQKAWAEEYALKDPAGFRAFLEHAPRVVPVGDSAGASGDPRGSRADEVQLYVNKLLGVSEEDFKKYGGGDDGADS